MLSNGFYFIFARDSLFLLELLFSDLIVFRREEKKKYFWLRVLGVLVFLAAFSFLVSYALFHFSELFNYARIFSVISAILSYSMFFALQWGIIFILYDVETDRLFSLSAFSFVFRQTVFSLYVALFTCIDTKLLFFKYESFGYTTFMIYLAFYSLLYLAFFVFNIFHEENVSYKQERSVIIILFTAIFANMVVCSIGEVYSTDDNDFMYVILLFSNIISLLLLTSIEFIMRKMYSLRNENQVTRELLHEKENQFKFAKANMERLHIVAHDIKHQANVLRKGGDEAKKVLDNLDDAVTNYDAVLLTENQTLNIILNEKWLYCQKHSIRLSTIVDPNALNQLETIELYSLFGNLLDNAIEAVIKIKEKGKRTISLNVTHTKGVSSIDIRNYFTGEMKVRDDGPMTSKKDSFNHGYGTKSIRDIVEKHNGDYSSQIEKDIFIVKIVIPD